METRERSVERGKKMSNNRTFDELKRVIGSAWTDSYRPNAAMINGIANLLIATGWVRMGDATGADSRVAQLEDVIRRSADDIIALKEQHRIQLEDLRKDADVAKQCAEEIIAERDDTIGDLRENIAQYQELEGWDNWDKDDLRAKVDQLVKDVQEARVLASVASGDANRAAADVLDKARQVAVARARYEVAMKIIASLAMLSVGGES